MGRYHKEQRAMSPVEAQVAEMWARGASSAEIGAFLGTDCLGGGRYVSNCRQKFPDAFPRRREGDTLARASHMADLVRAVIAERPDPRLSEVLLWIEKKAARSTAAHKTQTQTQTRSAP